MPVRRIALPPRQPLLETVGSHLIPTRPSGPVSLANTLVIVPTRHAGRRLREHLALLCAEADTALLDATITLPHTLFRPHTDRPLASPLDEHLAWCAALRQIGSENLTALFPNPPALSGFAWQLGQAEALVRLRNQLGEASLTIQDVPDLLGATLANHARWRDLHRLECIALAQLEARGLVDPVQAKSDAAQSPQIPPGTSRIILAALPDPPLLAIHSLECLAETSINIEVLIPCLEEELELFDNWGRPDPTHWCATSLDIPDDAIRLCGTPELLAEEASRCIAAASQSAALAPSDFAIAAADPDLIFPINDNFVAHGLSSLNPAGVPFPHTALYPLVQQLIALAQTSRFAEVMAPFRQPLLLRYLARACDTSGPQLLRSLDKLHQERLPVDLDAAIALALNGKPLHRALSILHEFRTRLTTDTNDAAHQLRDILLLTLAGETVHSSDPHQTLLREATEALNGLIEDVAALADVTSSSEQLHLLRKSIEQAILPADQTDTDFLLEGWLEMAWNPAPWLVVAGCNEGLLPDGKLDDPFLPDRLRLALGLRSDINRHARDAHLLHLLIRQRNPDDVALLVARLNDRADTLKPSRLLFQGVDAPTRIRRVKNLFSEPIITTSVPARSPVFPLHPGHLTAELEGGIKRLSVTDFGRYLACPFRFFLGKVGRLNAYDPDKAEPDAANYGSLIHEVLSQFGQEAKHSSWEDSHAIAATLHQLLDAEVLRTYGTTPSLAVRYTVHSARERLGAFANVQATLATEGWRTVACEHPVELPFFADLELTGTIDRIDRHADGRIRVIDYKTGEQAKAPKETHFGSVPKDSEQPECAQVNLESDPDKKPKIKAWVDLQLPLYAWCIANDPALKKICGAGPVSSGYIALPKALSETAWIPFDTETDALRASGIACAEYIAQQVAARAFWPPSEKVRYDDLAPWLHHDIDQDIDPDSLIAWMEAKA